ncbi:MAG: response regulator [Opitutaceae bacterium]|nr:response regulator [Opitutaceae bacterium]
MKPATGILASPCPRILVVDDVESLRWLLVKVLRRVGYIVDMAGDGCGALRKIRESRWDAVILDMELPDMTGLELYEQIRREDADAALPVVFITGRPEYYRARCLSLVPEALMLAKPFDAEQLVSQLEHCLGARPLKADLPAVNSGLGWPRS